MLLRTPVTVLLLIAAGHSSAQPIPSLPTPTGRYGVGRVTFHWVDPKRAEPATEADDDRREILVHVWYPAAKPDGSPAAYLPHADRLSYSAAAASLANVFGPIWPAILANQLRPHAFEKAPVAPGTKLPVLVFSPGGGAPAVAYTAQMEELASHGYLVAGVEHTYDSPGVVFPDGRVATAANAYWDRLRRASSSPEKFEESISALEAADVVFAIDKIRELEVERTSAFFVRLDLDRIGVFGHSRGGRTAARVCQIDQRVKACVNQDGNWSWQPFWLDSNGRSLQQPFMTLDHRDPALPDEVFVQMGTTRQQYARNRSARQAEAREKLYETIAGGSYHVTITTPGISHNSFSDLRQLGRADGAGINIWPKDIQAATPHARLLTLITGLTRAFFDRHVRGMPGTLLELARIPADGVEIRRYGVSRE